MGIEVLDVDQLHQKSTEKLKQELLTLTQDQDSVPFSKKIKFFKGTLEPILKR